MGGGAMTGCTLHSIDQLSLGLQYDSFLGFAVVVVGRVLLAYHGWRPRRTKLHCHALLPHRRKSSTVLEIDKSYCLMLLQYVRSHAVVDLAY